MTVAKAFISSLAAFVFAGSVHAEILDGGHGGGGGGGTPGAPLNSLQWNNGGAFAGGGAPTRAGDLAYWNGSAWVDLAGNNSGTNVLQEDASGVPSWVAAPASGVSSITTVCPASGPSTGAVILNGNLAATARSPVTGASDTLLNGDCSGDTNYSYAGTVTVTVESVPPDGAMVAGWNAWVAAGPSTTLNLTCSGCTFFNNGTGALTVSPGVTSLIRYMGANVFQALAVGGGGSVSVPGTSGQVPTANGSGGFGTSFSVDASIKSATPNVGNTNGGLVIQQGADPIFPYLPARTPTLFYPLIGYGNAPGGASSGITAGTTGYFLPFMVDGKQTWSELDGRTSTPGTTTCTFAIYGDGQNSTTNQNQPFGAPLATVTTPIANTGAAVQWDFTANSSLSANLSFLTPGRHWLGMQCNDATIKFSVPSTSSPYIIALMGSTVATGADGINLGNLNLTGMTYNTWPTFAASQSFGVQNAGYVPAASFKFVSAP